MGKYSRDTSFNLLDFDKPEIVSGIKDMKTQYESSFNVFKTLFTIFKPKQVLDKDGNKIPSAPATAADAPKFELEEVVTLAMIQSIFLMRMLNKYLTNFSKFVENAADKATAENAVAANKPATARPTAAKSAASGPISSKQVQETAADRRNPAVKLLDY